MNSTNFRDRTLASHYYIHAGGQPEGGVYPTSRAIEVWFYVNLVALENVYNGSRHRVSGRKPKPACPANFQTSSSGILDHAETAPTYLPISSALCSDFARRCSPGPMGPDESRHRSATTT